MSGSGWRGKLIAWRNRQLSSPAFQQWAAGFPLTRLIAKRRAQSLFDLVAGFVYSQTLVACVRLGVFGLLADGPMTTAALAERLALSLEGAERLMSAAAALGLTQRMGRVGYGLGQQGAVLLGNAGLLEMIAHHEHLYADLADSAGLLRRRGQGSLAGYWPYATSADPRATSTEGAAAYSQLMAATQPTVAADILQAYPVGRHRRLMDVGGGEGAFLVAAGAHAPNLDLMLFDLPAVTVRAEDRLRQAGLLGRTDIRAGDFLSDPIADGADLITLIRILHDHDDAGVLTLLRGVRAALPPAGVLLIAEPMSGGRKPNRVGDVYFAFYLLAMGRGRARSPEEIFALLRQAGFGRMRSLRTRTPFLLRVIVARP